MVYREAPESAGFRASPSIKIYGGRIIVKGEAFPKLQFLGKQP
jgi:hypothetical protein